MQNFVPTESVVVVRGGKRVTPKLGVSFPFTDDEVKHLTEHRPEAIRKPINEGGAEEPEAPQESDAEIEDANEAAIEQRNEAAVRKAGEKALTAHGAGKAVQSAKAAKAAAAAKVDDL